MTPKEYMTIRINTEAEKARLSENLRSALDEAAQCKLPPMDRLRLASVDDAKRGAVLWYPQESTEYGGGGGPLWSIVDGNFGQDGAIAVMVPTGHGEARAHVLYALHGAFVEIEKGGE